VQLVVVADMLEEAKRKYGPHLSFAGVKMLGGGPKWLEQAKAAADKIAPECTHVILHDAARPAVPYSDIDALMEAAPKHDAVVLAAPVRTTLVEVDEGCNAMAFHLAPHYMHLLTPQVFLKAKFAEMAASGKELHPSQTTILKGSSLNIRLGGSGDASLAKAMINMLPKAKVKPMNSPFEEAQW
jgi:2-C-methyl-D-erythritol 4-phosphate cytidylyltransferase